MIGATGEAPRAEAPPLPPGPPVDVDTGAGLGAAGAGTEGATGAGVDPPPIGATAIPSLVKFISFTLLIFAIALLIFDAVVPNNAPGSNPAASLATGGAGVVVAEGVTGATVVGVGVDGAGVPLPPMAVDPPIAVLPVAGVGDGVTGSLVGAEVPGILPP